MGVTKNFVLPVSVAALSLLALVSLVPNRQPLPDHFLHHPLITLDDFFTEKEMDQLMDLTHQIGVIPPTARDSDSYKMTHEDVGEATPYNGSCPMFLIPNAKKTHCIFPSRIDVGRHLIRTGGPEAVKESYETLVTRVYSFMKYLYNIKEYPVADALLSSPKFQKLATDVCPKDKQLLDPIQLNLVVQLPGQTVATHIDAPYFVGANRFHVPIWLLSAMAFSGLFQDKFVDQVQVVGYYHKWVNESRGGNFVFWNNHDPQPVVAKPTSKSANSVDGSKVAHAAAIYMPEEIPPKMPPNAVNELHWRPETKSWDVVSDGKVLRTYPEDLIRFSVVYRARCFKDEAAKTAYHESLKNPIPLDDIFATFEKDLIAKGKLAPAAKLSRYELGVMLLDTYVKYPLSPDALIPYNYCALEQYMPSLKPVLQLFCR